MLCSVEMLCMQITCQNKIHLLLLADLHDPRLNFKRKHKGKGEAIMTSSVLLCLLKRSAQNSEKDLKCTILVTIIKPCKHLHLN